MRTISRRNRAACSILAMATVLTVGATPAAAQVAGTGNFSTGTGTINTGTGDVSITGGGQAVIDWTATPGNSVSGVNQFLTPGNSLNFSSTSNFAVLNRVDTGADLLGLNGTVSSSVNGNPNQGSVYFYNPNGIVVGGSAVFNVGSLVLSTSPILVNGGAFIDGNNQVVFQQGLAGASINVQSGAQINAITNNSYVALVAPRVVHNGAINVNGSAALVGAEAATITFSPDGLFDITVTSGTTDANGVIIGGDIGGPQAGIDETQRIYAVAVPKNQALTLAITAGADLGFEVAGAANVDGNAIVLSAGRNIVGGAVDTTSTPGGTGEASINAQNFNATSALNAVARTDATLSATTARTFSSDVNVQASREARVVASTATGDLTILGDVFISADLGVAAGASGAAGTAAFYADSGAQLTAQGNVSLSADAYGADSSTAGVTGGNATGGTVGIVGQFGGNVDIWGNVFLSATGSGGSAQASGVNGGTGRGGTAQIQTFGVGSTVDIGGNAFVTADGYGGSTYCVDCTGLAGLGQGGNVFVGAADGADNSVVSIGNFESGVFLSAAGEGGDSGSDGTTAGTGEGGNIFVWSLGNASDVSLNGYLSAYANGNGGDAVDAGVNGGLGDGGGVYVSAGGDNASLTVTDFQGWTSLSAEGQGGYAIGEGCMTCNGSGGEGRGGDVQIFTSADSPGASVTFTGAVYGTAAGWGGDGVLNGGAGIGGGAVGSGSGGASATFAAGTSITFEDGLTLNARGEGGDGIDGNGGSGIGGRAISGAQSGATGGILTVIGDTYIDAGGAGGDSTNGTGGLGDGGQSDNGGNAGSLDYQGNVSIAVQGIGGQSLSGAGGDGIGGNAWLESFGASINVDGNVSVDAAGQGGAGGTDGGDGLGGFALIAAPSSTYDIGGNAQVIATGTGGDSVSGTGGLGGGGEAIIRATGGILSITGNALLNTDGTGGDGVIGGVGDGDYDPNNGVGGSRLRANFDSQLTIGGNVQILSRGFGGNGTTIGGSAFGGLSQILSANGADIVISGLSRVDTDAFGGVGAQGTGGYSHIFAGGGGTIGLHQLNMRADGYGGNGSATLDAGNGYGGTSHLEAAGTGSSVSIANAITDGVLQDREMLSADGFGGTTYGAFDGVAGLGQGGTVNIYSFAGANVSLSPAALGITEMLVRARGYGGLADADNTTGGDALGGIINVVVDGATMTTGQIQLSSYAQGGSALSTTTPFNITGGTAYGGERHISVLNGATLSIHAPGGVAGGSGGDGYGTGNSGNGGGGIATLTATDSTLNITGNTIITAQNLQGQARGTGNGGNATGNQTATINIANSTVNIASGAALTAFATGYGAFSQGGMGGDALGGNATATITNSTVTGGSMRVLSYAAGGEGETGGGDATAGLARLTVNNSTITGTSLAVESNGAGGWTTTGSAGNGTAGTAQFHVTNGVSTLNLGVGQLLVQANGTGGSFMGTGGIGGLGTGGFAEIWSASGTGLTVNGGTLINAAGVGGASYEGASGSGGTGDAGTAAIFTDGGTMNFNGNVALNAAATGGSGLGGTGGNALGGTARVGTVGGNITVSGTLGLDGSSTGGNGTVGGNAIGLVSPAPDEIGPIAASLYVQGSGNITVAGATTVNASATGGAGSSGNGGNATAGETDIVAYIGDITLAGLTLNGNALGGNGALGGIGGSGTGGVVDIAFGLDDAAVSGIITIGDATVNVNGTGGNGGTGAPELAGGSGGVGTGGVIYFVGSAAGGSLQTGNAALSAVGTGGTGGDGGISGNAVGGAGGNGGNAFGGAIVTGTLSNSGAGGSGGDFDVGNLSINTSATGGNGGNGGFGGAGNGAGGNGGNASGGESYLWIRGVDASADAVTLIASAAGGNGGGGSVNGNGGNATTGLVQVESKDRFDFPSQRGNLVADSISATAVATGGTGAIAGTSTLFGGSYFRILNGDADIGSVNFLLSGTLFDGSYYTNYVSVRDGTALIDNFSFSSSHELALDASNATMTSATITLDAGTFVPNRPDVPAPTVLGTYVATTFDITTGGDFITNANLDSVNIIDITAPGSIIAANMVGDAEIYLNAQSGGITVNNLNAALEIDLAAAGDILANDLNSGSYIIASTSGDVTINNATSVDSTDLTGNTSVTYNTINAGAGVTLNSNGLIQGGNITAIGPISAYTSGSMDLGILSSDSNIDLLSYEGNIDVLEASADGYVDLRTYIVVEGTPLVGGYITAGNISAGNYAFVRAGTNVLTGDISAVNAVSVFAGANVLTGAITAGTNVTAQAPGTMALGLVNAGGTVLAESTGALTLLDITAAGNVEVNSGTSISAQDITSSGGEVRSRNSGASTFGALVARTDVNVGSIGALTFASAEAGESVRIGSDASITGGNVTAGDSIVASTFGLIDLGDLSAGIASPSVNPAALYEVALVGGSIDVGTINAAGDVQLAGFNGVITGNVTTSERMFAVSNGNIALGNLSLGGQLLIGGWGLFEYTGTIHVDSTFDARPTFANSDIGTLGTITVGTIAADDVQMMAAGNIVFASANVSGQFDFESGASVNGGNVTAVNEISGNAQGSITLGNLVAGIPVEDDFSVGLLAVGNITVGNVDADGPAGFATQGNLTTGAINAVEGILALVGGNTTMAGVATTGTGGGQVYIGDDSMLVLGGGTWDGEGDFDASIVLAQSPIATGGSITINGPISTGLFRVAAGTTFTTGNLGSGAFEILADAIDLGDIITSDPVALSAASGISTGNIESGSYVDLFSLNGNIETGIIDSASFIALEAGGSVTTGDLFAGTTVEIQAAGNVSTGNIEAGIGGPVLLAEAIGTMNVGPGNSVEIFSDASIDTGDITTDGYVGLYAAEDISVGAITAEHDVIALAGDDAAFGAINTPERFILAGYGNFDELQGIEFFDPELIFGLYPIDSTGGDATFAGQSNALQFEAYVGGNTTIQSITATPDLSEFPPLGSGGFIYIDTGGTLAINGTVSGSYVSLLSSDIAIAASAAINASDGISFLSINPDGTFIGDGIDGTDGYRLSQSELDLVNADAFEFEAQVNRGASDLMVLGDLEFDIQTSGDEDVIEFSVTDEEEDAIGIIRVVGDVVFTLGSELGVEITAQTFEIDAETGSLSLIDSSGALAGILDLEVENIFIASSEILAQLEENPQYEGYINDLNAPAAVQRPDGVLRAAAITLNEDDAVLQNILIQNTGTQDTPAGFLINEVTFTGDEEEGSTPLPGSINMVINGQVETETGTLTGDAVRALFVQEFGTEIFVEGSTINGCTLTGDCSSFSPEEQIPPAAVVTPTQIAILTSDPIGEMDFGNEGDIDDSVENDGSDLTSPIEAPQPLFDTRPLDGDEDINEPVSGAGNPSLYGATSDEEDDEDEDGNNGTNVKPTGQTDGRTGGAQ